MTRGLPPAPAYLPGWEAAIAALLTDMESALAAAARELRQADIEAAREIVTEARGQYERRRVRG